MKYNDLQYACTVIKIDVEGMGFDVVKGALNSIKKHRPHLFLEAETQDEFIRLNNYLRRLGYLKLTNWAFTPVYHFAYKPKISLILTALNYKFTNENMPLIKKIYHTVDCLVKRFI